jgi:hypothetical protein
MVAGHGMLTVGHTLLFVVAVGIETAAIAYVQSRGFDYEWLRWGPGAAASVWLIMGPLLALSLGLLQIRASAISSHSNQLVRSIVDDINWIADTFAGSFIDHSHPDQTYEKKLDAIANFHEGLLTLYGAWCNQMRYIPYEQFVREFVEEKALPQFITKLRPVFGASSNFLDGSNHSVAPIEMVLHEVVAQTEKQKYIGETARNTIAGKICELKILMNKCYYLKTKSKIDFSVCQILEWMIIFQSFTAPFPMVSSLQWFAIPAAMIITFAYTSFFYSALLMSEPFGDGRSTRGSAIFVFSRKDIDILAMGKRLERSREFSIQLLNHQLVGEKAIFRNTAMSELRAKNRFRHISH